MVPCPLRQANEAKFICLFLTRAGRGRGPLAPTPRTEAQKAELVSLMLSGHLQIG